MKNYTTFLKKELLESVRTYKMFVMLVTFAILGIMNPLFAKLTPEIIAIAMPEGMNITIAEPSAIDSWIQFYKNLTQIGLIVAAILFSGVLSTELSKGTLINMITKGLSRSSVILSKYTYMLLLWTISLVISFLLTWGYTIYLFPGGETANLLFAVFCLWLFGVFLLAILIFAAAVIENSYGCLFITGAVIIICMLFNMIPAVHKYNPCSLVTDNMDLIQNAVETSGMKYVIGITGILSLVLIGSSVLVFRKKQL